MTPLTDVAGSQNWAAYVYVHPTATSSRNDSYRGATLPSDGTQWLYDPKLYKGNETFTTLQGVRNAISSTGGWAQLNNAVVPGGTKVSDKLMSIAELDQISPGPVMRGVEYGTHLGTVWGSAAFNGYGWFFGCEGGHYAYWGNDMFLVRVADPVGVYRLYDPAPIEAVSYNEGPLGYPQYTLVPPAQWNGLVTSELAESFPAWGPRCTNRPTFGRLGDLARIHDGRRMRG